MRSPWTSNSHLIWNTLYFFLYISSFCNTLKLKKKINSLFVTRNMKHDSKQINCKIHTIVIVSNSYSRFLFQNNKDTLTESTGPYNPTIHSTWITKSIYYLSILRPPKVCLLISQVRMFFIDMCVDLSVHGKRFSTRQALEILDPRVFVYMLFKSVWVLWGIVTVRTWEPFVFTLQEIYVASWWTVCTFQTILREPTSSQR